MKFSKLPNEMLFAIVKRLPIGDLRQVGSVCRRLYDVQQGLLPSALSSVVSIRIDMEPNKLPMRMPMPFYGKPTVEADFYRINERHGVMVKFAEDDLNRSIYDLMVTKDSVQALATWFPNIKRLTIVVSQCDNLELSSVVSLWPNLTELTIVGCENVMQYTRRLMALSHWINQLKSLKALVLDLPLYQINLSIFGQLEHLTCKFKHYYARPFEHHLQRWSEAIIETMTLHTNIKTMGLWLDYHYGYVDYSNWPSQVTNRITRLVHREDVFRPRRLILDVICDKFSSLTFLHLGANSTKDLTLASALPSLSKLHHLQVLYLTIKGEPPAKDSNLPLLQSVKQVTFLAPLDPHHLVAFEAFFPNALRVGLMVDVYQWPTLQGLLCHKANCANCTFLRLYCTIKSTNYVEQTVQVWLD